MSKMRTFYWSVRRELWENPALWVAPLAIEAVVLFGYLVSSHTLPRAVANAAAGIKAAKGHATLDTPFAVAAAAAMMISFFVAVFYALGALHNERRDRSLLFWKSLPVSDLTAVSAKAMIPLVVLPLVSLAVVAVMHLIMLAAATVALLLNNVDPMNLWTRLPFLQFGLALAWGAVVTPLWLAPIYGWLLLVSAWAKRAPFLWAAFIPLAIIVVEGIAFRTHHFAALIGDHLAGAFGAGFVHNAPTPGRPRMPEIDVWGFISNPGLWIGLAVAAAFLAGAVWMRRTREPA
jgi:ABC-2 type transport system permease protein